MLKTFRFHENMKRYFRENYPKYNYSGYSVRDRGLVNNTREFKESKRFLSSKRKFYENSSSYPNFYIVWDVDEETGYEGLGIWSIRTGKLVFPLPEEIAKDEDDNMRSGCKKIHIIAGDPDLTAALYEIFDKPRSRIYNNGLYIWYKPLKGGRVFSNIAMVKSGGPEESISYSNISADIKDAIKSIASDHALGFGLSGDESYEGFAFWYEDIPELPLKDSWVIATDNSLTIKAGSKEAAQAISAYLGVNNVMDIYNKGLTFITPGNDGTPNIVDVYYANNH